jgi:hypothetical protein
LRNLTILPARSPNISSAHQVQQRAGEHHRSAEQRGLAARSPDERVSATSGDTRRLFPDFASAHPGYGLLLLVAHTSKRVINPIGNIVRVRDQSKTKFNYGETS